jgi:hypothetical protein
VRGFRSAPPVPTAADHAQLEMYAMKLYSNAVGNRCASACYRAACARCTRKRLAGARYVVRSHGARMHAVTLREWCEGNCQAQR